MLRTKLFCDRRVFWVSLRKCDDIVSTYWISLCHYKYSLLNFNLSSGSVNSSDAERLSARRPTIQKGHHSVPETVQWIKYRHQWSLEQFNTGMYVRVYDICIAILVHTVFWRMLSLWKPFALWGQIAWPHWVRLSVVSVEFGLESESDYPSIWNGYG